MLLTIGDVLDLTELREIRREAEAAAFRDGRMTAGYRAKAVKKNEQVAPGQGEIGDKVRKALQRNPEFKRAAFPRKVRLPIISRYQPGMEYGTHVDDALMGPASDCRSDISVTVFLSDPGDYEGGELEIENAFGPQQVKLPAGAAVLYPSSSLHRVRPVETGERLAAVTWVQSQVRDPQKRELLYELGQVRSYLHKEAKEAHATDLAFKTYANLLRLWAEP